MSNGQINVVMRTIDTLHISDSLIVGTTSDATTMTPTLCSSIFTIYVRLYIQKLHMLPLKYLHSPLPFYAKPVSCERSTLELFSCKDLLCAFKIDGYRQFLVVVHLSGVDHVCMYDCNWKGHLLHTQTVNRARNGVIYMFDTEMLDNTFHVHDILVFEGASTVQRLFTIRYNIYTKVVKEIFENCTINVIPKIFQPVNMMLSRDIHFPDKCDGLIFVEAVAKVTFGTDWGTMKWKPPHLNTVDMLLVDGAFYVMNDNTKDKVKESVHIVPPHIPSGSICEMRPCWQDNHLIWVFKNVRTDKNRANSVVAYNGAKKSFRDNITVDVLRATLAPQSTSKNPRI